MKTTRFYCLPLIAGLLVMATACGKPPPSDTTIQEFMQNEVNPAGDTLFQSVQQIADERGVTLKAPRSDADWQAVRARLTVLHDAPDVLTADGIRVAPPGTRSEYPGFEDDPAEIQRAVDSDRPDFNRRAYRLRAAADGGLQAVDAKDPLALMKTLDAVQKACESCHLKYFYPKDRLARMAAKEDGVTE